LQTSASWHKNFEHQLVHERLHFQYPAIGKGDVSNAEPERCTNSFKGEGKNFLHTSELLTVELMTTEAARTFLDNIT